MKVLIIFSLLVICGLAIASQSGQGCLCTSDQSCWPNATEFSQLQAQVSQPLVYPLPAASACYPTSDPSGNCTAVTENWADGNWRSSMPGAMEAPNWETFMLKNGTIDACYLNTTITGTCGQGRVPVIGIDARSVADIQAGVNFAVKYSLKLVIKNTGHDFLGRSAARGSFVVWTHNLKNITYNPAFVPQGAPANETYNAVTLGGGVQWHEAYDAVNQYGRMMVGGISAGGSIGAAGGWLAGGGHSALSPTYGLGADNAIEISVVLSTGEYLTVNDYQNSDLFWALRGGGGSTYGIVTSVTYRTYPSVPLQLYGFQANSTNSSAMQELVGELLRSQPQFTDDGWGGYGSMNNQTLSFEFVAPNMTNETAIATTQAWTNYALSLEPWGVTSGTIMSSYTSFYDFYEPLFSTGPSDGANIMFSSRLLSRDTLANKYKGVAQALLECSASFNMIAGGKVNQIDPDSAGLNPAWRNAVVETVCGFSWQDGTSTTELRELIDQFRGRIKTMYDLTPNDGAYFNEASLFEINWQETFFGSHYSTLKSIKNKYDPHKLFVVVEGVGSDDWNKELTCRS
ncbi:FAD-binding domain-containing protein [Paxillus ammoniavirescens]|nr:FAD-binding domain-containing protein [Paxillus ammoniavirescens]